LPPVLGWFSDDAAVKAHGKSRLPKTGSGGQFTLPQELEDHVTRRFLNTQLDLKAADGLFE